MIREIDMNASPRRAQFEHFRTMANPYVSVTVNVDITHLWETAKAKGRPFFLTMLHCVVNAANSVPELRRRIRGDRVVEYDNCISSHTVALPDDSYCYCELDCSKPFSEFLPYAQSEVEKAKQAASLTDEDPEKLFFISSLPWITFTSLDQPLPIPADSNPRIIMGKYFMRCGLTQIPVNLTANHALVDGIHLGRFFEKLQELCDAI